jgi:pilus assembly protein CpaB
VNKRLISVLAFALVVSATASLILYRLVSAQIAASAKTSGAKVLVAARNLESGALIKETDLKIAEWGGTAPTGSLTKPEDAIGRGVVEPIVEGEPVVESRLAMRGAGAGLAAIIPPGMRAVAVRVNDVVGVAGFLSPGMKVDVLIAGNPPSQAAQALGTQTKTLLQNIEVLSAGQNIQKDAEGKPVSVPVVNMLVTPEQAEILSLASNETRIQLVLRNPTDKEVSKTKGTSIAYLFGAPEVPAKPPVKAVLAKRVVAPPPPPPPMPVMDKVVIPITVEVIHGSAKKELKFKNEDEKDQKPSPEAKP